MSLTRPAPADALTPRRLLYVEWLEANDALYAATNRFAGGVEACLPEAELLDLAHEVALLQDREQQSLAALSALRICPRRDPLARPSPLFGSLVS